MKMAHVAAIAALLFIGASAVSTNTTETVLSWNQYNLGPFFRIHDDILAMSGTSVYTGTSQAILVNLTTWKLIGSASYQGSQSGNTDDYVEVGTGASAGLVFVSLTLVPGVHCYNVLTNSLLWKNNATGTGAFMPSYNADRDEVYVIDTAGTMWAFAAASGKNLWSVSGKKLTGRPVVMGDAIVATSTDSGKTLYAFDTDDRSVTYSLPNMPLCNWRTMAVAWQREALTNAYALTCDGGAVTGLVQFDFQWGKMGWRMPLTNPPGPIVNNMPMAFTPYSAFVYNGSNVAQDSLVAGTTQSLTPIPSDDPDNKPGTGLVNFAGTFIVSGDQTQTLQYFDANTGAYAGKYVVQAGTVTQYDVYGDSLVAMTNANTLVRMQLASKNEA